MAVRILIGDALSQLNELPAESVHTVVTSPPYWGLRTYKGDDGLIGLEETFEEHVENLVAVFRQVRRVLRHDGTLWLNYGDAYAGSGRGGDFGNSPKQRRNVGSEESRAQREHRGFKAKDLMMMPARIALALQSDGADMGAVRALERAQKAIWDAYYREPPEKVTGVLERLQAEYAEAKAESWWLRGEIVWHKLNPMPESVTDRPTMAHEKVFLLTKSRRYFYDHVAVRTQMQSRPGDRHLETIAQRKARAYTDNHPGSIRPDKGDDYGGPRQGFGVNGWDNRSKAAQQAAGANLRNVWSLGNAPFTEAHFATFPPGLVEPCIKAGTSKHGVCASCGAPFVRVLGTSDMADAGNARPQGDEREGRDAQGREDEALPSGLCGGTGLPLFAPPPDSGQWPVILDAYPLLAPAIGKPDLWNAARRLCGFPPLGDEIGRRGGLARDLDAEATARVESVVRRMAHGLAYRVDRLRAGGNGVVCLCAADAWLSLSETLQCRN